jgi:formylglycine-generating enzyme required for sulfatase activity
MSLGSSVVRKPGATWFLSSEDEWYKAAYYKGGGTDAGYWDYATQSDTAPTAELPAGADLTNGSANFYDGGYLDTTYYTTEVGAYTAKPSDSAYDTFDQGGNVWEWNEAILSGSYRGLRGGSFSGFDVGDLLASFRLYSLPTIEYFSVGFRVSEVPEPATMAILMLGGIGILRRRKCVRR